MAGLQYRWTTATDASRTSAFDVQLVNNAAALATYFTVEPTIITIPAGTIGQIFDDAVTSSVTDLFVETHSSSGTPAAGFGSGWRTRLENASTTRDAMRQQIRWTNATDATRQTAWDLQLNSYVTGLTTVFTVESETSGMSYYGLSATATINADQRMFRWSRPQTPAVKFANNIDWLVGSYGTSINAETILQVKMTNGATDTPDTTPMQLFSGGAIFDGYVEAATKFRAASTDGVTVTLCNSFVGGICTSGTTPSASFALNVEPFLAESQALKDLRAEIAQLRAELASQKEHHP